MTKKRDGYTTPKLCISYKVLIDEDLFIDQFWDDWNDYRDGFRNGCRDKSKIRKKCTMFLDEDERIKNNRKLKKKLRIRKCHGKVN